MNDKIFIRLVYLYWKYEWFFGEQNFVMSDCILVINSYCYVFMGNEMIFFVINFCNQLLYN